MHFDSLSSFFAMGGYAIYVWPTFTLTGLIFVVLTVHTAWQKKVLLAKVLSESARRKRIEDQRKRDKELKEEHL
jgi:heme exporter protein D